MENIINHKFYNDIFNVIRNWVIYELPGLIVTIVLFIIALIVLKFLIRKLKNKLIKRVNKLFKNEDPDESIKRIVTLTSIAHGLLKVVLWTVFIIMIMPRFGISIAPVLASAGVIGLAIGFGAQELVRDYISGLFILLEDQIRAGDIAVINGTAGLVEKIELRTITLRDLAGTVHIFQNGKINSVSNMTKDWSAIVLDIGVAYKEDTQKVMDIMKHVGDELQNDPEFKNEIIEPIEIFGLNEFANSALVIKARIKTKPIYQWSTGREYRKRLKIAFDKNNIEIPFPHTTIYWGSDIDPLKVEADNKIIEKAEK